MPQEYIWPSLRTTGGREEGAPKGPSLDQKGKLKLKIQVMSEDHQDFSCFKDYLVQSFVLFLLSLGKMVFLATKITYPEKLKQSKKGCVEKN